MQCTRPAPAPSQPGSALEDERAEMTTELRTLWDDLRAVQEGFADRGYFTRAIRPGPGDRRSYASYPCSDLRCAVWHDGAKIDAYSLDVSLSGITIYGDVQHIRPMETVCLGMYLTRDAVVFVGCEVVKCVGSELSLMFLAQDPSQVSAFISSRVPPHARANELLFSELRRSEMTRS